MIKLTHILLEILNEDRCKRIADRKYDKPSAYKSGAIVRCRQGKIWKDIKEEKKHTIKCKKCGWEWDLKDGGSDPFICHKCGYNNYDVYDNQLNEKQKETLHTWFKHQGPSGKEGGWVDCNTCRRDKTGKKKCKSCGRKKGEKRSKYPSCRPTPSQCSQPGKGKKWGKTK